MITRPRRRVAASLLTLATLLTVLMSGCSTAADKATDSAAADLQKEYAQQPGVASVNVESRLPNESISGRRWRATIALAPGTTPSEQAALIVRFFDSAGAHELPTEESTQATTTQTFGGASFTMDEDCTLNISTRVDAAIGEITDILKDHRGFTVQVGRPDATPASTGASGTTRLAAGFERRVDTPDAAGFAREAADTLATLPRPRSFTTTATVTSGFFTVATDHAPSSAETGFVRTTFPTWLKAHPVSNYSLPLAADGTFRLSTKTAEPDAVRALATSARAAGIHVEITAAVTNLVQPYVTIPRG